MIDTKQIQAAIRETLHRNLEILIGESAGHMDAQDDAGQIRSMQAVTTRDMRAMLDACAANIATMIGEYVAEERDACVWACRNVAAREFSGPDGAAVATGADLCVAAIESRRE